MKNNEVILNSLLGVNKTTLSVEIKGSSCTKESPVTVDTVIVFCG